MTMHTFLRRLWFGGLLGLGGLLGVLSAAWAAPTPSTVCGTISQAGTYVLQSNLTAAGTCLTIDADFVTLNLNGFTLTGDGSGAGIACDAGQQGLEVRNGTVRNFDVGIDVPQCDHSRISGVRVIGNSTFGIFAGLSATGPSVISGCMALNNGLAGLILGYGTIRNSMANNNDRGLWAHTCPTLLLGNVATNNASGNLFFFSGSAECVSVNNIAP
jgi:hypothetical protein